MAHEIEDLRKRLETQIKTQMQFPTGPSYKSMRKNLAKIYFESGEELEGIFNLVESHSVSLRTRAHCRYTQASYSESETCFGLDGSLVQHGGEYECKGVSALFERLSEMPEEWSLVQLTYAYNPEQRFLATTHPSKRTNCSALHIVRFECGSRAREQPPYCVTVPIEQKFCTLEAELRTIIEDHQSRLKWGQLSSEQYYRLKGTLDMRMKNVVTKLQNDWLGHWISLLVGRYVDPKNEEEVSEFVDRWLEKNRDSVSSPITTCTRQKLYQLSKASVFLPEWTLCKGIAELLEMPAGAVKELAQRLKKLQEAVKLRTARRHPVILLLDEDLELFPWEMLIIVQDHPVSRLPSLHMLYALFRAHKDNISGGSLQVDAQLGYYIVNPEQNLPRSEKRLRLFLPERAPSWKGTFGLTPRSDEFKDALQNYKIFVYCGHGSGSQFLQGDEIQKLRVQAVTFLFGCSSVTNKDMGGRVEPTGIWHFYHIASCPMVIGNLWAVTDIASDAITVHTLHNWLPGTQEMALDAEQKRVQAKPKVKDPDAPELWCPNGHMWKHEPDLLYAIRRSYCSYKHYLGTAALVARGLPVTVVGQVEKKFVMKE